jgi:hypothetical protein
MSAIDRPYYVGRTPNTETPASVNDEGGRFSLVGRRCVNGNENRRNLDTFGGQVNGLPLTPD